MWKVAGFFYDLQKGFLKAVELGNKLSQEFGAELEQAVLVDMEKDQANNNEKIRVWEEENKAARVKWKTKLKRDKKVRNVIGVALICGLLAYPVILLVNVWLIGIDELPSVPLLELFYLFSLMLTGFLFYIFPPLFIGGSITYLVMLLTHNSNRKRSPKLAPRPEVISRYYEVPSVFLDLGLWWRYQVGVDVRSYGTGNNYGVTGEERLIDQLSVLIPDEYLCLMGVLIDKKLDADVVLIGPAGIWVLESKYYSGKIILKNGEWYRHKTYYERGGYQTAKEEYLDDFAKQWQREKRSVLKTLKNSGLSIDIGGLVKGGLVFTHPDGTLSIDESSTVEIGDIGYWCQSITEEIEEMDKDILTEQQIIQIADAILANAKKLSSDESFSAVTFANDLYKKSKLTIVMYIDEHKPGLENYTGSPDILTSTS